VDTAAEYRLDFDVIVIGAGPVGLTVANFLGEAKIRVLVIEQLERLIDYPRGVGMDDECLRAFQSIGLADKIIPHTLPNQWLEFQTAKGRPFARIQPRAEVFGWPKRNAFIQPLVDKVLFEGLSRYESVSVKFGCEMLGIEQTAGGVTVRVRDERGEEQQFTGQYVVGCDGGRSPTRKQLGIAFEGQTESTRWLVVDIANDPIGIPNAILVCDPRRPYVTISLPHGIRRLEFMVKPDETDEIISKPEWLQRLLTRVMPSPERAQIIRSRVYTHHARLAAAFQKDRVFLAGDAAHLMPVWQGQGYNSGIRDAYNLSWKLIAVLRGLCDSRMLETYTVERRNHASAMISLSTLVGRIFSPTNRAIAAARDLMFIMMNRIPPIRDYVVQMRFKPMPRYAEGIVVPVRQAFGKRSGVGRLFIQPRVGLPNGGVVRFDDAVGNRFALIAWGADPAAYLDGEADGIWSALRGGLFTVRSPTELFVQSAGVNARTTILGDVNFALKDWFSDQGAGVAIVRPDRFVAALCSPQEISATVKTLADTLFFNFGILSTIPERIRPQRDVVTICNR
jgi:3-(3-hydroxy-phenyl)propionate hydroxylase